MTALCRYAGAAIWGALVLHLLGLPREALRTTHMLMKITGALVALVLFGATAAHAGPSCTIQFPRGFKVAKGTKKKPLVICKNGDLQSTWGGCTSRYST